MTEPLAREGTLGHRGHAVWWGSTGPVAGDGLPLLTVHGGPGICHDCLEPLAALRDEREVFFYDQFGCGRSDRATDPDEYTVDLFVEELARVRNELAPGPLHLFAHSYGGPIAFEYLLTRPEGIASFTIANSFASIPALVDGWHQRWAQLSPESAQALTASPPDPARFGAAMGEFVGRFVYPSEPPEPLVRSQAGSGAEVYAAMHGSSWFVPDGQWAGWDVTGRLAEIAEPTLVVGGERDQCVPALAQTIAAGVPHAELAILDAAHLPFFEVPDQFLSLVAGFLARAESTGG